MSERLFIAKYARAFNFCSASIQATTREGYLFKLKTPDKYLFSEAAPLPGYHTETAALLEKEINSLTAFNSSKLNSIAFARDALFFQKNSARNQNTYPIETSALLNLGGLDHFQNLYAAGFRYFKLKVSPTSLASLLQFFSALSNEYSDAVFRLDSNSSLSGGQAQELSHALKNSPIEYWEDPFAGFERGDQPQLNQKIAVDIKSVEHFAEIFNRFSYFVIKPSILGSWKNTQEILNQITSQKKHFIIGSCLESEIGTLNLLDFISTLRPQSRLASGLSAYFYFSGPLLALTPKFKSRPSVDGKLLDWLNTLRWIELK